MEPNKFKGKSLVIEESKFVTSFYNNSLFSCSICNVIFDGACAVVFNPISKITPIFGNYRFCQKCALKLIDNPDKIIFEYSLGLLTKD